MVDQGITVDPKYLDGVLDAYDTDQSGEIELGDGTLDRGLLAKEPSA